MKNGLFLVFNLFFLFSAASLSAEKQVIKIGIFPYKRPKTMISIFLPLKKKIETALGIKVELVTTSTAASYIIKLKNGEYDVTWACVSCYLGLGKNGQYKVVAKGFPEFYGGVVVKSDSAINELKDLRGKNIAAIGEHSYAGYRYIKDVLEKQGMLEDGDIHFYFMEKLDRTILSVITGKYEAGVIRLDALNSKEMINYKKQLRVIHRSLPIPQFPFIVKKELDEKIIEKIATVLVNISKDSSSSSKKILSSMQVNRFERCEGRYYEQFRERITKNKQL